MTTDIASEAYIQALEEIAQMGPDYRAEVPAGTPLGSEAVGDGSVNWRKRQSLVRAGGVTLPERVRLYNRVSGDVSIVPPTIAQKRIMQGTKQYPASAFTLRDPGLPQREPIPETCEVCDKRRAAVGNPPRRFFDIMELEAHQQALHPRWWEANLRRQLQTERMEERQMQRDLIAEMVRALRPDVAFGDDVEEEITDAVAEQVERRTRRRRA